MPVVDPAHTGYVQLWRARGVPAWRVGWMLVLASGLYVGMQLLLRWLLRATPLAHLGDTFAGRLFVLHLVLAFAVPAAWAAVRGALRQPAGYLWSVAGHLRWRWLARCWLVGLPLLALFTLLDLLWLDPQPLRLARDAGWLLLLTVVMTPLQCAGEEVVFRGLCAQAIGRWVPSARAALVLSLLLPSLLFAAVHGNQNAALFGARFALGVVLAALAWRTGGLEASIALHTLNNQSAFVEGTVTGTLRQALSATDAEWESAVVQLALVLCAAALMLRASRQGGAAGRGH